MLNVSSILPGSNVNGPGRRFVIWVQGCSLRCPQCINEKMQSSRLNLIIPISELYKLIISTPNIEGVTYSGGEPFEQAESLFALSLMLRNESFTIMSYSGYTYQELIEKDNKSVSGLLSTLDILVDGRFEEINKAPLLWRGSRNQKIYFLTEKYRKFEKYKDCLGVNVEITIGNNDLTFTGNLDSNLIPKLKQKLEENFGVILK